MFFQSLIVRIKSLAHARKIIAGLNKEFWIGHFLIMVSTVLGVYLAAHSGLKTAVEFDAITIYVQTCGMRFFTILIFLKA